MFFRKSEYIETVSKIWQLIAAASSVVNFMNCWIRKTDLEPCPPRWELLIDHVIWNLFPFLVDLLISLIYLVKVDLAKIVEQTSNRHRLFCRYLIHQKNQPLRILVHINRMVLRDYPRKG